MFRPILLSVILLSVNISYSQWFQQTSGTTVDLNSIFYLGTGQGFIAGNSGAFLKSTDGGVNWNLTTLTPAEDFNDIYFINPNEGIIVGNGGLILRTTDGGTTWNSVSSGVFDNLHSVSFNGLNGIIGGSSQTILYSTNGGTTWNISQEGFFGGGFSGAHMLNSNTAFVAGQNSIFQPFVGKSTDGGITWEFFNFYFNGNEGFCTDIYFFDENNGIVSGILWDGQGAISRTSNGGTDWVSSIFTNGLTGLDFPTNDIGYAVGLFGTILNTANSGLSWIAQTSGTANNLYSIDFTGDALNGNAVGEAGILLKTANGGVPVELISFTCQLSDNKVLLNWETASEINNRGFEIERSVNRSDWRIIGFKEGKGTTTEIQEYSFADDLFGVNSKKIYYRLKQIDFDGSYEYSNVIEIDIMPSEFSLSQNYPNPFNPVTTIKYSVTDNELVTIKVYDIAGREVMTLVNEIKSPGNHTITLDSSTLSSGIYFYQMKAGSFSAVKQLMILK